MDDRSRVFDWMVRPSTVVQRRTVRTAALLQRSVRGTPRPGRPSDTTGHDGSPISMFCFHRLTASERIPAIISWFGRNVGSLRGRCASLKDRSISVCAGAPGY